MPSVIAISLWALLAAAAGEVKILPPGLEGMATAIAGSDAGTTLEGGWTAGDIEIAPGGMRFAFVRRAARVTLVLEQPGPGHAERTAHFGVRLDDPGGVLDSGARAGLLRAFAAQVRAHEPGESPWRVEGAWVDGRPGHFAGVSMRSAPGEAGMAGFPTLFPVPPTLVFQAVLLAAMLLLAIRWRRWRELARRVPRADWAWIAAWTLAGAALRTWGGVRVPGHINGHGYDLMRHLLFMPITGNEFHGVGSFALHRLALVLLPRHEYSVVGVQCLLSIATVPAIYAATRLWLRSAAAARGAAAAAAVLPAFAYYAMTEERFVPGVFFLVAATVALGAAVRSRALPDLAAAALLAAVACEFQPFLSLTPIALGFLLLADHDGRAVLRSTRGWLAVALFALLAADAALLHLRSIAEARGPASMVPGVSRTCADALWPSADEFARRGGNVFLNPRFTPPPFALLAVLGVIGAAFLRGRRALIVAVVLAAFIFTVPALVPGRMNTARLQLAAQPFYLMLTGAGVAVLARVARRRPAAARLFHPALAAVIALSVAVWPGAIGADFTPQMERRFIASSLPSIKDGCVVVWPEMVGMLKLPLPVHLSMQAGRAIDWEGLSDTAIRSTRPAACIYYYRPVSCFDVGGDPVDPLGGELRDDCARIERAFELAPALLTTLPAVPDNMQVYTRDRLTVGFFRVLGVRRGG